MTKRVFLIFAMMLLFLCLVSCSALADTETRDTQGAITTGSGTQGVITTTESADSNALTTTSEPPVTTLPQQNVTIVLDAGHGENDPGAYGTLGGEVYWEKGINLAVVLKLKGELEMRGYTVVTIRDDDISMLHGWDTQAEALARRELGTGIKADLYLSLHCNSYSGGGRAWGPIVFYNGIGSYSPEKMVKLLQASITDGLLKYEKTRACRIVDDGDYIVLKDTRMPSFLIEMGFLTDESDLAMLLDEEWQAAMAKAIADGVDAFYSNDYIR